MRRTKEKKCHVFKKAVKVAAYPSLQARIYVKFHLLVISTLKMNSVCVWFELQMDSLIIRAFY